VLLVDGIGNRKPIPSYPRFSLRTPSLGQLSTESNPATTFIGSTPDLYAEWTDPLEVSRLRSGSLPEAHLLSSNALE